MGTREKKLKDPTDRKSFVILAVTVAYILVALAAVVIDKVYMTKHQRVSTKTITVSASEPTPAFNGSFYALDFTEEDFRYMAQAIYFEAQGEPIECQFGVAQVIMNRVSSRRYPDTVREVIWQDKQFSYTHDGKHERMEDIKAELVSNNVALAVLGGEAKDFTEGSLFYFNPYLADPDWQHDYYKVTDCANHSFYKIRSRGNWG